MIGWLKEAELMNSKYQNTASGFRTKDRLAGGSGAISEFTVRLLAMRQPFRCFVRKMLEEALILQEYY